MSGLFSKIRESLLEYFGRTESRAPLATPNFSFIYSDRPASINNRPGARRTYAAKLLTAFRRRYPTGPVLTNDLYCRVYHFYRVEASIDADNISKPTLDALNQHAYVDDFQVKIRTAGSQDVGASGSHMIELSRMEPTVAVEFAQSIGSKDHTLYIEIGDLKDVGFVVGLGA